MHNESSASWWVGTIQDKTTTWAILHTRVFRVVVDGEVSNYVNTVGCVLMEFTQLSEIADMNGTRGLCRTLSDAVGQSLCIW